MINNTTLGLVSAAVPLLIIGFVILRRLPWIFAFFVALLAVGLGYLETTGAMREFGHQVRAALPAGILPEHKKAEAPATEAPATEAPAMAPATPPAEPPATPPATPAPDTTQPSSPPASPSPAPASPAP